MSIQVKWGREKLHLPLPPPDARLADLRAALAEHTALPAASFKLIHAGAMMKDDNAPLTAYGIHANSIIALIGGGEKPLPGPKASTPAAVGSRKARPAVPATEEGTIATIRAELATMQNTIGPALDTFLSSITARLPDSGSSDSQNGSSAASAKNKDELELEHTRLGELLLQSLLRLDVLAMDGAWAEARKERKVAVRAVQSMLDRLDGGWKERTDSRKA